MREVLNDVERECIVTHGYGLHSFAHALVETFERLSPMPVTSELHAQVVSFTHSHRKSSDIEFLPEVPETLEYLSQRHRLILVTKGAIAEQSGKVERSGLKRKFVSVEIVAEKKPAVYPIVADKYDLHPRLHVDDRQQSEVRHQSRAWPPACTPSSSLTATPGSSSTKKSSPRPQGQKLLIVGRFAELREHF